MPAALDPSQTFCLSVRNDEALSEADRPALEFRYLSAREYMRVRKLFNEAAAAQTDDVSLPLILDGIRVALVGWQNMPDETGAPIAYDPADLDRVLTVADLVEVKGRLLGEMTAKESDLKKSAWQSASASATAGGTDPAGNASTAPPPASPSSSPASPAGASIPPAAPPAMAPDPSALSLAS